MGSCFSTTASASAAAAANTAVDHPPAARVIDVDGKLVEYSGSLSVAHVLGQNHPFRFLCNSDTLFYGRFIRAMGREELLQQGELYFVLPGSMLRYRLTAADMAALAVRESSDLAPTTDTGRRRSWWKRKVVHMMPVTAPWEVMEGYKEFNEASVGSWKTCLAEKRPLETKKRSPRSRLRPIAE